AAVLEGGDHLGAGRVVLFVVELVDPDAGIADDGSVLADHGDAGAGARAEVVGERVPAALVVERERRGLDGALDEREAGEEIGADAAGQIRLERRRNDGVGGEHEDDDEGDRSEEESGAQFHRVIAASPGSSANRYPAPRTVSM